MTNQSTYLISRGSGFNSDWMASLNRAIKADSDPALWRVLNEHPDQVEAYNCAAEEIGRMGYKVMDRLHFAEMFALPVIDMEGTRLLQDPGVYTSAAFCISEVLDGWLPPKTSKTVFSGLRSYDWVSSWRFSIQRSHLLSTVPGTGVKSTMFLSEDIQLPPEAPRLAFILMVLTSTRGWVQLPAANTARDNRLKAVVSYALQAAEAAPAPLVMPPEKLRYAMADGLCLWLSLLHQVVPITGWIAAPTPATPDVVKITLALEHQEVGYTQFTLRKHQLGLSGLDGVLAMLAELAPRLDHPMDVPAPVRNEHRLLLT